jgi:hypothetical protein
MIAFWHFEMRASDQQCKIISPHHFERLKIRALVVLGSLYAINSLQKYLSWSEFVSLKCKARPFGGNLLSDHEAPLSVSCR